MTGKPNPFSLKRLSQPAGVRGLSKKVVVAIEHMVLQGMDRKAAAEAAGLRDDTLYRAFRNPLVRQHYNESIESLRTSERARNLHTAAGIRDDDFQPGKTRIDAARFIEGEKPEVRNSFNAVINVQPGYMIDVSKHAQRAIEILRQANPNGGRMIDLKPNAAAPGPTQLSMDTISKPLQTQMIDED